MLLTRHFPELWKFGTHERAARGAPLMLWTVISQNAGAERYSTFRRSGLQAGYAVTAAKTLVITRVLLMGTGGQLGVSIGYADADLGISAAADGANPVLLDSSSVGTPNVLALTTALTTYEVDVYYEIPAAKFPRIAAPAGAATMFLQLFGHEV